MKTLEQMVKDLQLEKNTVKSQLSKVNAKVKENAALLDEQEQYMHQQSIVVHNGVCAFL